MISRSRSLASSAESRTGVGGGSRVSKAVRGRELAGTNGARRSQHPGPWDRRSRLKGA